MPKPDLSPERLQRLPLTKAIDELRQNLEWINRQVDEAFPNDPQEAAEFRAFVASFLAEHRADHAALDEMEAGLLAIAPPAGVA
jgi:hypothetical protein